MYFNLIKKTFKSLYYDGVYYTLKKIKVFFSMKNKKKLKKKILNLKKIDQRFSQIYETNYWLDNQSRSGEGSNLNSAKNCIKYLPIIFRKYKIQSIFDAPCGDFNWMRYVLKNLNKKYIGGDIVLSLIKKLNLLYSNSNIKFIKIDIIKNKLPSADIMICRDCLFHFSNKDISLFLNNFKKSKIKYLLVTGHFLNRNFTLNKNILTGDFRKIDIFTSPFFFKKKKILYYFKDFNVKKNKETFMFLFKKKDMLL